MTPAHETERECAMSGKTSRHSVLAVLLLGLGAGIVVPDLTGWRSGRLPESEESSWISVVPDWICEVLSPGTVRTDRTKKASLFRQCGVPYPWPVDPIAKTLEVFGLHAGTGTWVVRGVIRAGADAGRAAEQPTIPHTVPNNWLTPNEEPSEGVRNDRSRQAGRCLRAHHERW